MIYPERERETETLTNIRDKSFSNTKHDHNSQILNGQSEQHVRNEELRRICKKLLARHLDFTLPTGLNLVDPEGYAKLPNVLPSHHKQDVETQPKETRKERLIKMNATNKKIKTLIVDDDVDSLLPIDKIFRKYGCKTEQALNYLDATRKIIETEADVIILDWQLGELTGGDLILQCTRLIEDNECLKRKFSKKPIKVITYSGRDAIDMKFSEEANPYFVFLGHWSKSNTFSMLEEKAVHMLVK